MQTTRVNNRRNFAIKH